MGRLNKEERQVVMNNIAGLYLRNAQQLSATPEIIHALSSPE
jgi:hypothetical protein